MASVIVSAGSPTKPYATAVGEKSPYLHWRVGEASGPAAADASGNGRAGTYSGVLSFAQPGALAGSSDTAVKGNGSSGHVSRANVPRFNSLSVELWAKSPGANWASGSLGNFASARGSNGFVVGPIAGSRTVRIEAQNNPFTATASLATFTPTDIVPWNHYVFTITFNGGTSTTGRIYFNGNLVATGSSNGIARSGDPPGTLYTLSDSLLAGRFGDFYLDEFAYYNRALAADEVMDNFRAGAGLVPLGDWSGSSPLALATVVPFARENMAVRGVAVESNLGASPPAFKTGTGFRLGTRHLLALDTTGARHFRAAVKDGQGVWSEWSTPQSRSTGNFVAGAVEASVGSGATADAQLQSPGIVFPDLSRGSGRMAVGRTLVSRTFLDEVRQERYRRRRSVFHVVLDNLDPAQQALLHRFFRALNGPRELFLFDYADPAAGTRTTAASTRHTVRFRDPALADGLFGGRFTEAQFSLVEAMDEPEGGDV